MSEVNERRSSDDHVMFGCQGEPKGKDGELSTLRNGVHKEPGRPPVSYGLTVPPIDLLLKPQILNLILAWKWER